MAQMEKEEAEVSGTAQVIPEALEEAIMAAGVEPKSSLEELKKDAEEDTDLHQAFETQVCHAVRERLNRDRDFNSKKYPNTERFFRKK